MNRTAAKVLLGVGVCATGFGAFLISSATSIGFDEVVAFSGAAIAGVGLALLGVGLGKLIHPAAGAALALVGIATGALVVFRAKAKSDEVQGQIAKTKSVAERLWSACDGKGVDEATAYASAGRRPTVLYSASEKDGSHDFWGAQGSAYSSWFPQDVSAAQLVACFRVKEDPVETCNYERGSYVVRTRYLVSGAIREAKTGRVVAEKSFVGGDPPGCASKVAERASHASYGSMPADGDLVQWVRGYVEGPKP